MYEYFRGAFRFFHFPSELLYSYFFSKAWLDLLPSSSFTDINFLMLETFPVPTFLHFLKLQLVEVSKVHNGCNLQLPLVPCASFLESSGFLLIVAGRSALRGSFLFVLLFYLTNGLGESSRDVNNISK